MLQKIKDHVSNILLELKHFQDRDELQASEDWR